LKINTSDVLRYKSLFPKANDIVSMTLQRDIIEKIDYSQEEIEKYGLSGQQNEDGTINYTWNKDIEPKYVGLTPQELKFLNECIDKQDVAKTIDTELFGFVLSARELVQ